MQHSWPRTGCPWPCHYPILLFRNHAAPSLRLLHTPHSPLRQKHHQDLKNESEQQPMRETTTKNKSSQTPKCSGANFQCSGTLTTLTQALSLCAKHLRTRQQAGRPLGNGDGACTSTAIAKVATRNACVQGTWGGRYARERDDGICLT